MNSTVLSVGAVTMILVGCALLFATGNDNGYVAGGLVLLWIANSLN